MHIRNIYLRVRQIFVARHLIYEVCRHAVNIRFNGWILTGKRKRVKNIFKSESVPFDYFELLTTREKSMPQSNSPLNREGIEV